MFALLITALLTPMPQLAPEAAQRSAKDAAAAFTLDSIARPTEDPAAAPVADPSIPAIVDDTPPAPVTDPEPASTDSPEPVSWLDVPISSLVANSTTRAVLDRDLPGLSSDENFAKFSGKSLREFQPLTGGQLTDALLAKVEADMKVAPPAPTSVKSRRGER